MELLPWHAENWLLLNRGHKQGNLPHAMLFTGPTGLGKRQLAESFGQLLLCSQPLKDQRPCGECRGCQLFAAGTHPDFLRVEPEEGSRVIKIDQIREVVEFFTLTSQYAGPKIIVIDPAETMNVSACNSLLKTLEEPPALSFLMLITAQSSRLPATIRSRCQTYRCPPPPVEQARAWLQDKLPPELDTEQVLRLAGGAPLAAVTLAQGSVLAQRSTLFEQFRRLSDADLDPVELAEEWAKSGCVTPLTWLHDWAGDMIRLRQAGGACATKHADFRPALQQLAGTLDLKALYHWRDQVGQALRLTETTANSQLLVEDVLLDWVKVAR